MAGVSDRLDRRQTQALDSGLANPGWLGTAGVSVYDGLVAVGVLAGVSFLSWVAYLLFLVWIVRHCNNDSKVLRDVAVAARAFPGMGLAAGIARALRPDGPAEVAREIVTETSQVLGPSPPDHATAENAPPPGTT